MSVTAITRHFEAPADSLTGPSTSAPPAASQTSWKATATKVWRIVSGADLGRQAFRTCATHLLLLGGVRYIVIQCAIGHPVLGVTVGVLGVAGTLAAANVICYGMVSLASRITGFTIHELVTPPAYDE